MFRVIRRFRKIDIFSACNAILSNYSPMVYILTEWISIDLNYNLSCITCDIDQFYNLCCLDINNTKIQTFPIELTNIDIRHLSLSNNNITSLPAKIKNLKI